MTTAPRFELPFSLHDGWGGKEWYFYFRGVQHGAYETEAEAKAAMEKMTKAAILGRRVREQISELPDDVRELLQLKGMI
jgi:hypothetical protein